MSNQSPTASGRDQSPEAPFDRGQSDEQGRTDQDEAQERPREGPVKGTDTPATTLAEDFDKAPRTTM